MVSFLRLLIICIVTTAVSNTETPPAMTSWLGSSMTLRIPRNFPPRVPLVTLAVLRPPADADADGGDDAEGPQRAGRRGALPATLAHLRLPPHDQEPRWASPPPSGRTPSGCRMSLAVNPSNAFDPRLQDHSGTLSLRLKRPLSLSDYLRHGDSHRLRVVIRGGGGGCGRRAGARPEGDPKEEQQQLVITVIITEDIDCANPSQKACFLPDGDLSLTQWENRGRIPLLTMPQPSAFCPGLTATYSVTLADEDKGQSDLRTDVNRLRLTPVRPFDRERRDFYSFVITCTIRGPGGSGLLASQTRSGSVSVLDEDDSPPFISRNPFVDWHYGSRKDDLDDLLMVLDPDLPSTNRYSVRLFGNTFKVVLIESVNKFIITKNLCMTEVENVTKYAFNASCTLLTPVVHFNDSCLRANLPPKINFTIEIMDRTLLPSIAAKAPRVMYNVTLTLPVSADSEEPGRPAPAKGDEGGGGGGDGDDDDGGGGGGDERTANSALTRETPPQELNVTVALPVGAYYRLGQLIHPDLSRVRLGPGHRAPENATFALGRDGVGSGVGVTPSTGVLYALGPDAPRAGRLRVSRGGALTVVNVRVAPGEGGAPPSRRCLRREGQEAPWCASVSFRSECGATCGLGAGGACSWRDFRASNGSIPSRHYATCSPALDTCPDGVCDELELQHPGICPQDCIDSSWRRNKQLVLSSGGRGIEAGLGVCTCDSSLQCLCFPAPEDAPPPSTPRKESTRAECGTVCQVGVTGGALVFLLFTFVCLLFCRRRMLKGGKQKCGGISLGTLPSEERSSSLPYSSRDETHGSLIHGIRSSPRPEHNLVPALNLTIDRKWEFPRSRLVIEQTLGEGEFGKVMKARAQGIVGSMGYTAVAVKMLKSNSTQAELADLLSEYSLLKEVSHPNVIKLLGACTSKGGPVYIIIEYCQYGSLRNFLKRSRHAEFEQRVGSGPADGVNTTPADYAITPKDLLSFARQICKGMAYLTDMKLVHRDLAARNVLLAEGKVCKISDFGLTRDVYEGDFYFKQSKGRVPVKWMALESLVDHIYTSRSDVWGFGVLLWELVTLGTPPYPGVSPERLFSLLKAGYRMEKPENCSQELYDVMLQCWAEDPGRRPCFQELTEVFENMIQADVEYLELRSLIVTNRGYFDDDGGGGTMMGLPEDAPPPHQFLGVPPGFQDEPLEEEEEEEEEEDREEGDRAEERLVRRAPPHLQVDDDDDEDDDGDPQRGVWAPRIDDLDADLYLVARTDLVRPRREESTEPLLTPTPTAPASSSHAHNPAYSPTAEIVGNPPLHYSTLEARPDEEDAHALECCRSEEDSDSGRATGDSGYATEEGRGRWRGGGNDLQKGAPGASGGAFRPPQSPYSPIPRQEEEEEEEEKEEEEEEEEEEETDDQDTSDDLEERQELLTEDFLGHLAPSPESAQAAHTSRAAHTPVIV